MAELSQNWKTLKEVESRYQTTKEGLGVLFGTKLAEALGLSEYASKLGQLFQIAFREFAYIVTEYKPTHGVVFADYLRGYSHWSYTDYGSGTEAAAAYRPRSTPRSCCLGLHPL